MRGGRRTAGGRDDMRCFRSTSYGKFLRVSLISWKCALHKCVSEETGSSSLRGSVLFSARSTLATTICVAAAVALAPVSSTACGVHCALLGIRNKTCFREAIP